MFKEKLVKRFRKEDHMLYSGHFSFDEIGEYDADILPRPENVWDPNLILFQFGHIQSRYFLIS